jgi:anti-sigma B factor antagonist
MKIAVHQTKTWITFVLSGHLDTEAGPGVYLRFQRELSRGHSEFVFDLGRVERVDSAGLGVLVRCYKDARSRGGMMVLQDVPEPIERILEFTRLNTIFPITDGSAEAATGGEPRAA